MINLYTILLATSIFCPLTKAADEQYHLVKIGAIFYKEESDLVEAFDIAVQNINDIGKKFELEGIKRFLSEDDSIILQKIACELLEDGVSAIVGPSSKTTSDIVDVLCNMTGIPHLQFDWLSDETDMYQSKYRSTVNVAPSEHMLSMALKVLVKKLDWKSFTIVYKKSTNLSRMQDLLAWKDYNKAGIKMLEFDNDYRTLWKTIKNSKERNVLLDCPADILTDVVNASIYFNMTGQFNSFLFSNLDTHLSGIDALYSETFTAKVTSIRIRSYAPAPAHDELDVFAQEVEDPILSLRTQCIYDAVVLYFNAVLQLYEYLPPPAPPRGSFAQPLVSCGRGGFWTKGPEIVAKMKNMDHKVIRPNFKTQRLVLNAAGVRDDFNLDIYNPVVDRVDFVWNKDRGIVKYEEIAKNSTAEVKKRKLQPKEDFSQKKQAYLVATRLGSPYFFWKPEPEGTHYEGNERFEGYVVDLMYKLAEECKFQFSFVPVGDNAYGNYDSKTNEWNGIIRELIDNKAQMGICDLTITQDRKKVVDFTVPFMQLGVGIMMHKPKPPEKNLFGFVKVYALDSWLMLLPSIVLMSVLHYIGARFCPDEFVVENEVKEPHIATSVWSMRNSLMFYLKTALNVGCEYLPRSDSMRILVTFWWIYSFFICQLYVANMTSFITVSKMEGSIKNLHDLINQDKISFGTVKGGATAMLFSESNASDYRTAYNKMLKFKPDAFTKDNEEGMNRVKRGHGKYAFLLETPSLKYFTERNCELTSVGEPFTEKHYGIAVPQNAEYRSNLSIGLLKLAESGDLFELKKKWFHQNDSDCDLSHPKSADQTMAVEMDSIGGAFLVLVVGLVASLIIAIFEFFWYASKVSARENVPRGLVLRSEFKFFLCFWLMRKPLKTFKLENETSRKSSVATRTPTPSSTTKTEITEKEKRKKSKRKRGSKAKTLCSRLRC